MGRRSGARHVDQRRRRCDVLFEAGIGGDGKINPEPDRPIAFGRQISRHSSPERRPRGGEGAPPGSRKQPAAGGGLRAGGRVCYQPQEFLKEDPTMPKGVYVRKFNPIANFGSKRGRPITSLSDRFWAKVNKNGPILIPELGNCWVWTASTDRKGYGKLQIGTLAAPKFI